MQHNMKAVPTKSGWAVSENQPYYLYEAKTKRACLELIDEAIRIRRELAERIAAAGWAPTTLTDIQAGTEYAYLKPNGELSAARPVAPDRTARQRRGDDLPHRRAQRRP